MVGDRQTMGAWKALDSSQEATKRTEENRCDDDSGKSSGMGRTVLGHAPSSIAGKHYVVKEGHPNPEFDKILDWMRMQVLDIPKRKQRSRKPETAAK